MDSGVRQVSNASAVIAIPSFHYKKLTVAKRNGFSRLQYDSPAIDQTV